MTSHNHIVLVTFKVKVQLSLYHVEHKR